MVEQFPKLEGRQMVLVLAPKKKEVKVSKSSKQVKTDTKNEVVM